MEATVIIGNKEFVCGVIQDFIYGIICVIHSMDAQNIAIIMVAMSVKKGL